MSELVMDAAPSAGDTFTLHRKHFLIFKRELAEWGFYGEVTERYLSKELPDDRQEDILCGVVKRIGGSVERGN